VQGQILAGNAPEGAVLLAGRDEGTCGCLCLQQVGWRMFRIFAEDKIRIL